MQKSLDVNLTGVLNFNWTVTYFTFICLLQTGGEPIIAKSVDNWTQDIHVVIFS